MYGDNHKFLFKNTIKKLKTIIKHVMMEETI